ncbi:VPS10 domain-containing protein [Alkalilimnicola ehrlichii]|uniref:VPS10 domain-containing protein n=1 Tax=Alkalilimnicola ehrlichii TaxID=351052 RepID=UPI003BA2A9A2
MTQTVLLVGTQKGLFRLEDTPDRGGWELAGPLIAGYEVLHAWLDPRDPQRGLAAVDHPVWGAHIYRTDDAGHRWEPLAGVPLHRPGLWPKRMKAVWHLAPGPAEAPGTVYAGTDPAGLFRSDDYGQSWTPVASLNEHPTRDTWEPARGGFSLHSILIDPQSPQRLYVSISAGGVFRSDDGGRSWRPCNEGVRAENLPGRCAVTGHNVHRTVLCPRRPERLYRQCYNGIYRSDDRGEHWTEISSGLPSDFGYALATPPQDPDTVYVIPIESNHLRTCCDGRLRVYRSRDGGRHWAPLTRGLPQRHAYVTVLREAMAQDSADPAGLYFGTSSGHLFASRDGGEHWETVAEFLPRVLSVQAARCY